MCVEVLRVTLSNLKGIIKLYTHSIVCVSPYGIFKLPLTLTYCPTKETKQTQC